MRKVVLELSQDAREYCLGRKSFVLPVARALRRIRPLLALSLLFWTTDKAIVLLILILAFPRPLAIAVLKPCVGLINIIGMSPPPSMTCHAGILVVFRSGEEQPLETRTADLRKGRLELFLRDGVCSPLLSRNVA